MLKAQILIRTEAVNKLEEVVMEDISVGGIGNRISANIVMGNEVVKAVLNIVDIFIDVEIGGIYINFGNEIKVLALNVQGNTMNIPLQAEAYVYIGKV